MGEAYRPYRLRYKISTISTIIIKRLLYSFFVIVLVCGCGNSNISLTGNVKFDDGNPLANGTVMLSTDTESFIGRISPNGNFVMETSENKSGIPAGNYTISVSSAPAYGEEDLVAESSAKPPNIEVIRGKNATLEITVQRAKQTGGGVGDRIIP
jgi:hypothetical protein